MNNGIVFNHFSLPFACREKAIEGLLEFFKVLQLTKKVGLKVLLLEEGQDKSLMGIQLAEKYFIRDWYTQFKNDARFKEWCRFLRSIETKQPLFDAIDFESISSSCEVGFAGESSGNRLLLAVFHFETYLLSFSSCSRWRKSFIDAWKFELGLECKQSNIKIPNLCDKESLKEHEENLSSLRNQLVNSAKAIWTERKSLFPHLVFLQNQAGSALQNWSARRDVLIKARDALNVMEAFCDKWQAGEYREYRHQYLVALGLSAEVSGESVTVGNDSSKRKQRMFWLEDGREVYCENHIKLPDGFRMHFFPDTSMCCIHIAYIGPHLKL